MGYEVDVIGVGKESKSGDAIALRWGNLHGPRDQQRVVLIDGGFRASGADVVNHIKRFYGTSLLDAVVSTHPDQDHVNGLHIVLDELSVRQLWIHKPWEHNVGLAENFIDGRLTDASIGRRLRESLDSAAALVATAQRRNIPIVEPFAGLSLYSENDFCVLGPTQHYYESLIPEFDGMPRARATLASLLVDASKPLRRAIKSFQSTWGVDALNDDDTTTAKNKSSVITALTVEGRRLLFTADAGITALTHAADQLDSMSPTSELRFLQVPHHGSRRNLGPNILNRLIGPPVPPGHKRSITAIASTAKKGGPKHPRKAVMNALTHRGVRALATRGGTIQHFHDAPDRGWTSVPPDEYYWNYEDED